MNGTLSSIDNKLGSFVVEQREHNQWMKAHIQRMDEHNERMDEHNQWMKAHNQRLEDILVKLAEK